MAIIKYDKITSMYNYNMGYTNNKKNALSGVNLKNYEELQTKIKKCDQMVMANNVGSAWLRTTNFNIKNQEKFIKENDLKFTFVITEYNNLYVALEYKTIYLVIKELTRIYEYNDLYKVFEWVQSKKILNLDMLALTKQLILSGRFQFDYEFNKLLSESEQYQIKIKIFE